MTEEPNGTKNGSGRLTWAIATGAASVVVYASFHALTYLLDRMDRIFERVGAVERKAAEHEGRFKELEKAR